MSSYDPGKRLSYDQEKEITEEVFRASNGRWDWILPAIVPGLREAVAKGPMKHVDCVFPDHQEGKKKFRISKEFAQTGQVYCTCTDGNPCGNGISLVMRALSCDFKTARTLVMEQLGMRIEGFTHPVIPDNIPQRHVGPTEEEIRAERRKIQHRIIEIWEQTLPLDHPNAEPAILWFENRAVLPQPSGFADVRFHPGLPYSDGEKQLGKFPCIVTMLRDNRMMTRTIHRTYITADGRKPVEIPAGETRKLFSVPTGMTAAGSAIRLDEPGFCLNVAEGLETALSVRRLTGLPTWSCVSKDLMKGVEIPEGVKYVTIWADKDRSDAGQRAAVDLYNRLTQAGIRCVAMLPPGDIPEGAKGLDWNDLLMKQGFDATRRDLGFRQWLRAMEKLLSKEPGKTGLLARLAAS